MNRSYYNGSIDFSKHELSLPKTSAKNVSVMLVTFNTGKIFGDYQNHTMREMSQVLPENSFGFIFPFYGQKHFDYNGTLPFTEYECPRGKMTVTRKDLIGASRLVALSFTSPTDDKNFTTLLCKVSQSPLDTNVYMTKDENILLRFRDTILDTISINHKEFCPEVGGESLKENHFLELDVTTQEKALYDTILNEEEFDQHLMTNGKISRYLKKRAHDAKKGAGKVIRKGNRLLKSTGSVEVKRASASALPAGIGSALIKPGDWIEGSATVLLFSNGFNLISPLNGRSTFSYMKKMVMTEGGDQVTVFSMTRDNGIGNNIGENNPGKYITLQLSDTPKMTFRVARVRPKVTNDVFYGVVESKLYIFQFDGDGDLTTIYTILKSSDAAKRLLATQ
jgi:hypothetical protein